jgi:hypothetical protein
MLDCLDSAVRSESATRLWVVRRYAARDADPASLTMVADRQGQAASGNAVARGNIDIE